MSEEEQLNTYLTRPTTNAPSYCGICDQLYPDKRSMGFPFDRQPRDGISTLQGFLIPNMKVKDVIIQFSLENNDKLPDKPNII